MIVGASRLPHRDLTPANTSMTPPNRPRSTTGSGFTISAE
jgi:hypothetical protein